MRKILVILLVAGLLIGTSIAAEDFRENSDGSELVFDGDHTDVLSAPIPCGGEGGGGGGGGGQPG